MGTVSSKRILSVVAVVLMGPAAVPAEDWPQWMGPRRDNHWRETGILKRFPADGLPVAWRMPVAGGYAGPAVADGRVFVADYVTQADTQSENLERETRPGVERIWCFDQASGRVLWKDEYAVEYGISYPAGPRCTPTVDNDRVYTLGAEGHLRCLDVDTGRVLWAKHLPSDYGTRTAVWGYASHPLVDGDKLICVVGGEGSHTVAFDKRTGAELWRSLSAREQGYSPPSIIKAGGVRQLVIARPDGISGLDPETGREYWSEPYEATNGSIIMTPVVVGRYLYVGSFTRKNLLLELAQDRPAVTALWYDEHAKGISPINTQPIVDGMTMYGFDQRGTLMAVELPSGERLWETPEPIGRRPATNGTAFIIRNGDRYLLFTENGDLISARLSPEGYEELDRVHVIEPTSTATGRAVAWSAPAYAGGRMYVRNDKEILAVDLSDR